MSNIRCLTFGGYKVHQECPEDKAQDKPDEKSPVPDNESPECAYR